MTRVETQRAGGRLAVPTAVTGTVLIAAGAFWLSFTALADLARRAGIDAGQAWAWPLIVDGIIVVATVAVVALASTRQAWYPWLLLIVGAGLSVTANSIHAIVAADADVPPVLAASVAAVPPLVLLAITHLTVILTRHTRTPNVGERTPTDNPYELPEALAEASALTAEAASASVLPLPAASAEDGAPISNPLDLVAPAPEMHEEPGEQPSVAFRLGGQEGRAVAGALRMAGWSNKKIARHLGLATSTVGRWYPRTPGAPAPDTGAADTESRTTGASEITKENTS